MFIVFEGIDGAGKTTLAERVTERLGCEGLSVHHARPKGELKSRLAGEIRTLARDPRNLNMSAYAELFLFLARDAQSIDSVIRPSLERADIVIADRYLYSALVLARARGEIPREVVGLAVDLAARDLWPDLVVYCDVDIDTSNIRKRIARIESPRKPGDFGRKGLRGLGLRKAMRKEYLALVRANPERWFFVDNAQRTVEQNVALIVQRILFDSGRFWVPKDRPPKRYPERIAPRKRSWTGGGKETVRDAFYGQLEELITTGRLAEAAYHLRSLPSQRAWQMRERLAPEVPHAVVFGLAPLFSPQAIDFRWRFIETTPERVARSLSSWWADNNDEAWEMREVLKLKVPLDVATTIGNLDSERAWRLREELIGVAPGSVLCSLKGLDSERAWALRDAARGRKTAWGLLEGIAYLETDAAWRLRAKYMGDALPWVILSLLGCRSERAWKTRRRYLDKATKLVIRSLAGDLSAEAWQMRRQAGPWANETLTTIKNVDTEEAWQHRDELMGTWPVQAAKSVGMTLARTERGRDFLWRVAEERPSQLDVLHYLVKAVEFEEEVDNDERALVVGKA
jgi:dTMP kinase